MASNRAEGVIVDETARVGGDCSPGCSQVQARTIIGKRTWGGLSGAGFTVLMDGGGSRRRKPTHLTEDGWVVENRSYRPTSKWSRPSPTSSPGATLNSRRRSRSDGGLKKNPPNTPAAASVQKTIRRAPRQAPRPLARRTKCPWCVATVGRTKSRPTSAPALDSRGGGVLTAGNAPGTVRNYGLARGRGNGRGLLPRDTRLNRGRRRQSPSRAVREYPDPDAFSREAQSARVAEPSQSRAGVRRRGARARHGVRARRGPRAADRARTAACR